MDQEQERKHYCILGCGNVITEKRTRKPPDHEIPPEGCHCNPSNFYNYRVEGGKVLWFRTEQPWGYREGAEIKSNEAICTVCLDELKYLKSLWLYVKFLEPYEEEKSKNREA